MRRTSICERTFTASAARCISSRRERPAPGGSAAEKLLWHQAVTAPPLSTVAPQSTPRLDGVLAKMMAKRPEERYASMPEVVAELEQCLPELPAADTSILLDGLEQVVDHGLATIGSSRYGQPTIAGGLGDTILTDFGRRSLNSLLAPPRKSRRIVYACGVGGALVLAILLAAPFLLRSKSGGAVVVTVDGGRADVIVNGESRGTVGEPAGESLQLPVKPGKVTVEVTREGFEPYKQNIDVQAGKPAQVAANLRKADRLPQALPLPHAPYQKLLDWIFSNQGQVTAVSGGGEQLHLTRQSPLGSQTLEILGIKLDGTGVRDSDLSMLAVAQGLRELSLADTRITDHAMQQLLPLRQLAHLNLSKTEITNNALAQLARLSELTELNLERTKITNPGIARLLALPKLERLYLSDTQVTDVGIDQLKALRSLRLLTLHGTSLSDAEHAALKRAIPELDIAWDGADVERGVALKLLDKGATLAVVDRTGQRHEAVKNVESLPPGRVSVKEVNLTSGASFSDDDLKQIAVLSDVEAIAFREPRRRSLAWRICKG